MTTAAMPRRVAVIGAGSWGTALALVLARNGHTVRLWGHDPQRVAELRECGENRRYLPGIAFPETLKPEPVLAAALDKADLALVVVPSAVFTSVLADLAGVLPSACPVTWATKGLDGDSGGLLHSVAERILPGHPLAVLSGPSFAREVANELPTAVTVACRDPALASELATAFRAESFRVYTSDDLIGVELGGAVKNVLAIACGVADGLGFGANARAGLVTRGLAEVRRLGAALGAAPRTLMGLAGVGDLILTCTDDQSRNRRFGLALGRGLDLDAAEHEIGQTVEGRRTAGEVRRLSRQVGVEMPICDQVDGLVRGELSPMEAARNLMLREPKAEFE